MAPSVEPIFECVQKQNTYQSIFTNGSISDEAKACFNCEIEHSYFPMKTVDLINGTRRVFCSPECMKIAKFYNLAPRVKMMRDSVERRWAVSDPLPNKERYKKFFQDEIVESRENLPYSKFGDQSAYPSSDYDAQVEGQYAEDIKFFVLEKERRFRALKRRLKKRRRAIADEHELEDKAFDKQKVPKKVRRFRPQRAAVSSKFIVPSKSRHNCNLVVVQTVE
eukprot:CAMPEP_0185256482 /NCGR_PEP_ID=MMETSP1359-20130426/5592_1 /TAXON_ID=552665 /ORGANISM="Bigelowiella longifila, Strain CCMP242" /LENGTH=221 /DNA_ID=CAMNT_0027841085 /DNA_START=465 /DNA_END=1130 /DNA_ORIENTATION=+